MDEDRNKALRELHDKIEDLARRQKAFQEEIQKLQNAVFEFDLGERPAAAPRIVPEPVKKEAPAPAPPPEVKAPPVYFAPPTRPQAPPPPPAKKMKTPIEEFIGTNLLNKVGIAVLVIGIGFGAKYSIDHNLINPLTRIISGYFWGVALIVLALRLKKSHKNFSAVLLSGGMAVFYFITFAAYDFYELIPQTMAFVLMVVFTAFTVFAATQYDEEVIGIIGLVGAYAVPFLLSDGSGRVVILFSYITIINTGILVLAFKKYWKRLYYLAFCLTWLSFMAWYAAGFEEKYIAVSLIFSTIFFLTFYTTFLAYKLIRKEQLGKPDLAFMLLNSFIYYGYGYSTIDTLEGGEQLLGLFTLFVAVIHFIACVIIYKQQSQFRDIFYFVAGMVLVFITLAVPVQLEGNWVTLVWAVEAALLFWIGRTKSFPVYEKLSYPLIALAFGSLLHDWDTTYQSFYYYTDTDTKLTFLLNIQFLTTALVAAAFGFILWLGRQQRYQSPWQPNTLPANVFAFGLPLLILVVLYIGIFKEVETFWNQRYALSKIVVRTAYGDFYDQYDTDILKFQTLWLICYSVIFALVLSIIQIRFIKDRRLMIGSLALNVFFITVFLTAGLVELSYLRSSYLNDAANKFYVRDINNILIRYLGVALVIPLVIVNKHYLRHEIFPQKIREAERILFHLAVLIFLSSELVHWLEMNRIENSFKLALSILWGAYALFLIILGLIRDLKYVRFAAIVLFGVTLIKLFLYDMAEMSTIAKTIVMIILGVLLLTASFLYNKYKRSTGNEIQ